MTGKAYSLIIAAAGLALGSDAFSPSARNYGAQSYSVTLATFAKMHADSEADALYLMRKARECAFSDTCGVDEAENFLHEVMHIQSGCVTGTLAGHNLCENQDIVAEIVSHLRAKAKNGYFNVDVGRWQASSNGTALYPTLGTLRNLGQVGVAITLTALIVVTASINDQIAVPFTIQEWWWALKGGYVDTMMAHLIRNGGL